MVLGRGSIKAIKAKQNENNGKVQRDILELQKKVMDNNVKQIELIQKFAKGDINAIEFQSKYYPLEAERLKSVSDYTGIKIEKK